MNSDALAFIMAGGKGERLYPLTKDRAKPAVPFGGIYRLIDFPLSNCVNSRMYNIVVLPQYKSQSLNEHLESLTAALDAPAAAQTAQVAASTPASEATQSPGFGVVAATLGILGSMAYLGRRE